MGVAGLRTPVALRDKHRRHRSGRQGFEWVLMPLNHRQERHSKRNSHQELEHVRQDGLQICRYAARSS
jgi:hypothetical protein